MTRNPAAPGGHALLLLLAGLLGAWGCVDFDKDVEAYCQRNPSVCLTSLPDGGSQPAPITHVSSRGQHSLARRSDGSVWAWGENTTGQLGDGTTTLRSTPTKIATLSNMERVAAGHGHSLALRAGKVWAWGKPDSGAIKTAPVEVPGLSDVVAIAAGFSHSLALSQSGQVWSWGNDNAGHANNTPVQVEGLPGIKAIAAGVSYSLALGTDGSVWAWGDNTLGQLGSDTPSSATPVKVAELPMITFIAAGSTHALALDTAGGVWTWGANDHGQLGDGTTSTKRSQPQQVSGLANIQALAGGNGHSLALNSANDVMAWGRDSAGQLGDDLSLKDQSRPVKTSSLTNATAISAGHSHSLAVLSDGSLFAWGSNENGRLGVILPLPSETIPTPLPVAFP